MLILTRRVGESLIINENIEVVVLGIKGNQVRIGANAPKNVTVHREEIHQRIQEEKNNKKKYKKECEEDAAVAKDGTYHD